MAYAAGIDGLTLTASDKNTTLTITGKGDLTSKATDVATEIRSQITASDANYSTIVFKSEGNEKCVINNNIVWAVLYTDANYTPNAKLETLNLGDVVVSELSSKTFNGEYDTKFVYPQNSEAGCFSHLLDLTLPLVKAVDDEVTLPSYVIKASDKAYLNDAVATIRIPEGYTKISEKALYGSTNLTSVVFPSTLKSIGKSAFAQCKKYAVINLNEGLETIGNCAFYLDGTQGEDQKVFNFPASITYVGPGAFFNRLYRDVYFYGSKAPVCPWGKMDLAYGSSASIFSSTMHAASSGLTETYNGINGDCSKGYANRHNYTNGDKHYAMLHFPGNLGDEDRATYTDITREYKTWTGTFTNKGNEKNQYKVAETTETETPSFNGVSNYMNSGIVEYGYKDTDVDDQYIWPSQSQLCRSYAVNSLGYNWDGVTKYRPELSNEQIAMVKADVADLAEASEDDIKKVAYLGTRQFTLLSQDIDTNSSADEYATTITSGERWWTLCVPCDVTKAEVDRVFGENTQLCLFSKVERKEDVTNGNELHLYFQDDTYKNKYTRATDGTWTKGDAVENTNDVVLYAHTPYMIYPTKNPEGSSYILKDFKIKEGDMEATIVAANGETGDKAIKYSFLGNYRTGMTIPQYSYVYGKKGNGKSQFWMYTGTKGAWGANKCLVKRTDGGEADYKTFFNEDSNDGAKQISTFGIDADVTAIEKVVFHYGDEANAPVYNLSGQLVNAQNGLVKGVYIKGGKKFVVK